MFKACHYFLANLERTKLELILSDLLLKFLMYTKKYKIPIKLTNFTEESMQKLLCKIKQVLEHYFEIPC